jgi:hypothetical protein
MGAPSKPIAKNSNNKFTTRNNKQDIFSAIAKSSKQKSKSDKRTPDACEPEADNPK